MLWGEEWSPDARQGGEVGGVVWKVKQDSERCGKTTDQPSVSPYSFSFSPAGEASSPPASWLLPPPGAADTCGNSPPLPPRTCWGRRRQRSAGRRWSRGASMGCSSWLAAKRRKTNVNWTSKKNGSKLMQLPHPQNLWVPLWGSSVRSALPEK